MIRMSYELITIIVGFTALVLYNNHNTRAIIRVIEHGPDPRRADPERCTAPPAPRQHPKVGP